MTIPTSQLNSSDLRRHSDSPILWMLVAIGSLLIHGLGILGSRLLLTPTIPTALAPEPILIEFDDLETTGGVGQKGRSPKSTNPAKQKAAEPTKQASIEATPLTTASENAANSQLSIPKSVLATVPEGRSTLKAGQADPMIKSVVKKKKVKKKVVEKLVAEQKGAKEGRSSNPNLITSNVSFQNPDPDQPSSEKPKNPVQPSPETELLDSQTDRVAKGPVKSGIQLPDLPTIPSPTDNFPKEDLSPSPLPINPITTDPSPRFTQFLAQITEITVPKIQEFANDPVPNISIPEKKAKTFSSQDCRLTPAAQRSFGQTVTLKLPLDKKGGIDAQQPISPQESSGNSNYDELASCVLKTWRLNPARDLVGANILSHRPSSLNVKVVITQ